VRLRTQSVGRVVVADLSASGSGLIVSPDDFGRVSAEPATFEFGTGQSFRVKLDPVRVSKVDQQLRVGARFQDLPVEGLRVLSQFLIREFHEENKTLGRLLEDPRTLTTRSPTFIRRHLRRCLLAEGRPLRVYAQGKILPISILAVRLLNEGGRSVIEARATLAGLEEGKSYAFVVAQAGSVTHFNARIEHRSDATLFIALPDELHQAGFRDSIRTGMRTSSQATLVCSHPRLPDELITRPLLDLSAHGFAFESDPESDLLFPGDRLSRIQVSFADEVYEGSGVIRGIAPHRGSDRYSCGVEIVEFEGPEQERSWRDRVFRHAHPRAVVTAARAAARQAWQVLDSSGYVRMWTRSANHERLKAEYSRSWSDAAPDVGRLMLVENRGETVGTLAGSLLYPRTWLVHQLGVAERERAGAGTFLDLAHELYAGLMYMFQHQASANYFVIFAERDKRWTQTLYGDFVAQYPDRSAFAYTENRVFRRSVTAPISRKVSRVKTVSIVPASPEHRQLISRALEASSSPVEFDSLAYAPAELTLEGFSETCRAHGSERARDLWVAIEAGA
jgi:hypothetical protein